MATLVNKELCDCGEKDPTNQVQKAKIDRRNKHLGIVSADRGVRASLDLVGPRKTKPVR